MIVCSVFNSVEFYVIASVFAAAIIAFFGNKSGQGPALQYLLPGVITMEDGEDVPSVEFICCDDGSVVLRRHGLSGVTTSGAVSLAVEKIGFDIRIKERVAEGNRPGYPINTAAFLLDFMGHEHYFISYESALTPAASSMFASVTLHNREGNRVIKKLQ